jgi:hypothetical protein
MKTTLRKLLSEIDFNNETLKCDPDWEELGEIFNIPYLYYSDDERLTCYFIKRWYCTDSWVGLRAYFLDGEFVAVSNQTGRKMDEEFEFLDEPTTQKLKEYLRSLVEEESGVNVTYLNEGDLEVEIPNTYKIQYNTQILHKTAFLNGEVVEIHKTRLTNDMSNKDYFHSVEVKKENGDIVKVDCRDLDFEYNK